MIRHELFGELQYERNEGAWTGTLPLLRLVAFGRRVETTDSPSAEEIIADLGEMLSRAKDWMSGRPMPPVVDRFQRFAEEQIPPDEQRGGIPGHSAESEAGLDRAADRSRTDACHREARVFPVCIESAPGRGPTSDQEAAGRLLIDREEEICRAIIAELFASYRYYFDYEKSRNSAILAAEKDDAMRARREALQQRYGLPAIAEPKGLTAISHLVKVEIRRTQIEGVSLLIFPVDCDWEQEHGMFLVYHPSLGAQCTGFDGLHEYELFDDAAP